MQNQMQYTKSRQKLKFTVDEDQKLIKLVNEYGENDWGTITLYMDGRNIRQCRERWKHYLSPQVSNAPWTEIEDALLNQKYNEYGPKWKKIAEFFSNRTYINIKNRFLLKKRHNERLTTQIVEISTELAKKMINRKKKCTNPYFQYNNYELMNNQKIDITKEKESAQNNVYNADINAYQNIIPQIQSQTIDLENFQDCVDDFLIESNIFLNSYDEYYCSI